MNIIVEGPDGSGKSTLVKRLSTQLGCPIGPRACTSQGGPVKQLGYWVQEDLLSWDDKGTQVYDRYPFVSEYIYGPLIRGSINPTLANLSTDYFHYYKQNTIEVVCLPPLDIVRANVGQEEQMEGVVDQIDTLYSLYEGHVAMTKPLVYNFTNSHAYSRLVQTILSTLLKERR